MKKILFSGELPPKSTHGVSYSNEINLSFLKKRFHVFVDEDSPSLRLHGKRNFYKIINLTRRVCTITTLSLFNRFSYFYIVFSTSLAGALKTLALVFVFRCFNRGKIIVHIHRGDLERFLNSRTINRIIFKLLTVLIDSYIVLSEETRSYIVYNFRKANVYVLENTISTEYSLSKVRERCNDTDYLFIYVSNYIEEKGILVLLDTFGRLPGNFMLQCFGNFTDLKLEKEIRGYNRFDNISINGPIYGKEKFEKINQADALILPSYNEGKPIVLLEAMSVATVFIASNVGYNAEIPYNGYPYLYYPNTIANLTAAILQFTKDENIEEIRLKLKERYYSEFSHRMHNLKLKEIFS